jgi:hypothetical protein
MADRFVFADEAGNFDFSLNKGASRYFILTTVTMGDCGVGDALAHLRRALSWQGIKLPKPFHATNDTPMVREAVFLHFKYIAPQVATSQDRLLVVAASLGTNFPGSSQQQGGHQQGHLGFGDDLFLLSPELLTTPRQLSAEAEDPRGSCRHKETAVEQPM